MGVKQLLVESKIGSKFKGTYPLITFISNVCHLVYIQCNTGQVALYSMEYAHNVLKNNNTCSSNENVSEV